MKNFTTYAEWLKACQAQHWRGPYAVAGYPHLKQFVSNVGIAGTWNEDFMTGNADVVDSGNTPVIDSSGNDVTTQPADRHRKRIRRRHHRNHRAKKKS